MEMALHEKERERAPGACACPPADAAARMGAPGRTHVRARVAQEVWGEPCATVRRGAGAVAPRRARGRWDGDERAEGAAKRRFEATRGRAGGLPRAARPQGPRRFPRYSTALAAVWLQGTAPLPRRSSPLIKGAGGEGAGLCEQSPWLSATPPSRSAPPGVC